MKQKRKKRNNEIYQDAAKLAAKHGLVLQQFTEVHYRLSGPGLFLDLYPTTQRALCDPNKNDAEGQKRFRHNGSDWDVLDVVRFYIPKQESLVVDDSDVQSMLYRVAFGADLTKLEAAVSGWIAQGFKPHGALGYCADSQMSQGGFFQAMIKNGSNS